MVRAQAAAAVLLVVGLGGAIEARRLTISDPGHPGPGFYPFWLALALCLVALAPLLRPGPLRPLVPRLRAAVAKLARPEEA